MAIKEYLRRVFPGTAEEFCQKAGEAMLGGKRLFVVTANPEILIHAEEDPSIQAMLLDEGLIYSDILEKTGASSATISRVNRCLHYGAEGYQRVIPRLKERR